MKVLSAAFAKENKDFIVSEMKAGKIFIYPTDTVYGIGCDSTNDTAVAKIHEIKRRENKPLLVIIPNINWIEEHCAFHDAHRKELEEKLPGPYSFIVTLQDKDAVSEGILQGRDTLGVRLSLIHI